MTERDEAKVDEIAREWCDKNGIPNDDDWVRPVDDASIRFSQIELGNPPPSDMSPAPAPTSSSAPDSQRYQRHENSELLERYRAALHAIEGEIVNQGGLPADYQSIECRHEHVIISETVTEIRCKVCGGSVDPWWWMRRIAREWGNLAWSVRERRQEQADLHRQIVDLKREIHNLSAKVKRRGGDPQVVRGRARRS